MPKVSYRIHLSGGLLMLVKYAHDLVLDDLFVRLHGVGELRNVALKLEGCNPAGSIKIKAARKLIASAEARGVDFASTTLVESSSGNLGIALSEICAAKGYRFLCVVDPNTNTGAMNIMKAVGAQVVCVSERDEQGGYLMSRLSFVQEVLESGRAYWLNQYESHANPWAHYESTAPSILREFPDVDVVVIGVGTAGTLVGCQRYFAEHAPHIRVIAVDSEGSVSFGAPAAKRHIPGLGASRRPPLLDSARPVEVIHIPEAETVAECHRLATTHGLLVGGSTGTAVAGLRRIAGLIDDCARVVVIAPDGGDRYLNTIYDDTWTRHVGLHEKEAVNDAVPA